MTTLVRSVLLAICTAFACGSLALAQPPHGAKEAADTALEHETVHGEPHLSDVFTSPEFWALVVNFALLLFVVGKLGRKPVAKFLATRQQYIQQTLNEAAQLKAEAEAKQQEYANRLAQLDQELASLRAEMVRAGEAERDRIVAEAEAKAARMRAETQFVIEQRAKQLRIELTREAVEAAVAKATDVLSRQATSDDQQRLAQQYLAALDAQVARRKVA